MDILLVDKTGFYVVENLVVGKEILMAELLEHTKVAWMAA